jgi:hypothetical protein
MQYFVLVTRNIKTDSVNKKIDAPTAPSTVSLREAVIKYLRENDLQNLATETD